MKSKVQFFSLSKALIKEDLRRNWVFMVLMYVLMFFSSELIIILKSNSPGTQAEILTNFLVLQNPVILIISVIFPVISSVFMFKYLHNSGSVSIMHSLPLTRSKLFFSKYLTGLIMLIVPVLALAVTTAPLLGPVQKNYKTHILDETISYGGIFGEIEVGKYSFSMLVQWALICILVMTFVYTLSVLAGIVTGNVFLHVIISLVFNFFLPIAYYLLKFYFGISLYGYSLFGNEFLSTRIMTPVLLITRSFGYGEALRPWLIVIYIVVIIGICLLARWAYGKRKVERAGSSLVFRSMEIVVLYMTTFSGMLIVGFLFEQHLGGMKMFYTGVLIGGVVTLVIASMIIQKSLKIFNKKSLIDMSVYIVVAAIFVSAVNFDLTGFEKRVPDPNNVKYATATGFSFSRPFDTDYFSHKNGPKITNKDDLKVLADFHKDITKSKEGEKKDKSRVYFDTQFSYDKKGIFKENREYMLSYEFIKNNENLAKLLESESYKKESLLSTKKGAYSKIFIQQQEYSDAKMDDYLYDDFAMGEFNYLNGTGYGEDYELKKEDYKEFIEVLNKDFMNITAKDMLSTKRYATKIYLESSNKKGMIYNGAHYYIPFSYKNTLNWMKEKGIYDRYVLPYDKLIKVEAYIINKTEHHANKVTIKDQKLRKQVFENCETYITNSKEYIMIKLSMDKGYVSGEDYYKSGKTEYTYFSINKDNPLYDQIVDIYEKYGQS